MELQNKLNELFIHTNDMIKFSEAKNAGLIAFNGAVIIGLISIIKDLSFECDLTIVLKIYLIIVAIFNLISIIISMSSLAAYLNHKKLVTKTTKNDNLLYFGDISLYEPEDYFNEFQKKYNLKSSNKELEIDTIKQIIITSQIAFRKYKYFNKALKITLASLATPIFLIFYKYYINPNKNK